MAAGRFLDGLNGVQCNSKMREKRKTMSAPGRTQVLILGGGFGGLYAALGLDARLARDRDVEITLVNRQNFSLFTPMLHEVATSDLDMSSWPRPLGPAPAFRWKERSREKAIHLSFACRDTRA